MFFEMVHIRCQHLVCREHHIDFLAHGFYTAHICRTCKHTENILHIICISELVCIVSTLTKRELGFSCMNEYLVIHKLVPIGLHML